MQKTHFPGEKIASPELLRLMADASEDNHQAEISVIIQVDLPPRRMMVTNPQIGSRFAMLTGIAERTSGEADLAEQRIAEAKAAMEKILGTVPPWLGTSESFIASVTPAQICAIAQSTAVKAIWLNGQISTGLLSASHPQTL